MAKLWVQAIGSLLYLGFLKAVSPILIFGAYCYLLVLCEPRQ